MAVGVCARFGKLGFGASAEDLWARQEFASCVCVSPKYVLNEEKVAKLQFSDVSWWGVSCCTVAGMWISPSVASVVIMPTIGQRMKPRSRYNTLFFVA